jgi:hypothetical protein
MPKLIKIPFKVTFSNQLSDDLAFGILQRFCIKKKKSLNVIVLWALRVRNTITQDIALAVAKCTGTKLIGGSLRRQLIIGFRLFLRRMDELSNNKKEVT